MWDLPGPGLEPVSPALSGGFLTTAPPGKSSKIVLDLLYVLEKRVNVLISLEARVLTMGKRDVEIWNGGRQGRALWG